MKIRVIKFIQIWGLLLMGTIYSSVGQLRFDRIGTQQGLSQSSIFDIFQDHNGFIWIATADGLNRYDGHQFTVYRQDFNDSLSLSSNDISCITEDSEGSLWIGTRIGGINKFDKKLGKFNASPEQKTIRVLRMSIFLELFLTPKKISSGHLLMGLDYYKLSQTPTP